MKKKIFTFLLYSLKESEFRVQVKQLTLDIILQNIIKLYIKSFIIQRPQKFIVFLSLFFFLNHALRMSLRFSVWLVSDPPFDPAPTASQWNSPVLNAERFSLTDLVSKTSKYRCFCATSGRCRRTTSLTRLTLTHSPRSRSLKRC